VALELFLKIEGIKVVLVCQELEGDFLIIVGGEKAADFLYNRRDTSGELAGAFFCGTAGCHKLRQYAGYLYVCVEEVLVCRLMGITGGNSVDECFEEILHRGSFGYFFYRATDLGFAKCFVVTSCGCTAKMYPQNLPIADVWIGVVVLAFHAVDPKKMTHADFLRVSVVFEDTSSGNGDLYQKRVQALSGSEVLFLCKEVSDFLQKDKIGLSLGSCRKEMPYRLRKQIQLV